MSSVATREYTGTLAPPMRSSWNCISEGFAVFAKSNVRTIYTKWPFTKLPIAFPAKKEKKKVMRKKIKIKIKRKYPKCQVFHGYPIDGANMLYRRKRSQEVLRHLVILAV